ncbi:MAG: response regulator [Pseudomonadota bacterium]|jgi:two-component system chemotaxis response regulator CheY|nr:response regulator [Alphaproteobacteria bacterium]MEC8136539.1 response regulator [Pseudomonadota bacterium]MEC8175073.1 response regulator [Pseudomonadota bacterium]MEC8198125.1 response regulator [Pseudomonadota bacterium]MEC8202424.1 response regulator [Pseudomonadota bacterium]
MADPEFLAEMEKLRVLVVDDEEELRDLLQEILRDIGIVRVHLAENGEMAWQRLSRSELEYDLVISDWLMPRMDGLQLLQKMRQWGSETPFMMLTVKVTGEAVAAAKEAGVTLYVAKPFTYGDFSKKISALAKQIIENKAAA